ncbi:prenylated flavin chaperone LpdD [Liquorilactobacillus mali]|uniref:prenylated flavin chaperone LpdD n=1 Tax=Liquorilactobacillus mali TaxID=1618 RepID=UPI002955A6CF|nr:amino acid decarboxylase [Liquorilactobacillus mali]MDV7756870.1 amino acid decarboxylase [Liquorilactobacillus mali]
MQLHFTTSATAAGYTITAKVTLINRDLMIVVTGGDFDHIGAITTIASNMELQTIRFPSHDGRLHQDHYISERVAAELKEILPGNCVVSAGVHVNQISKHQIASAVPMAVQLARQVKDWLQHQPLSTTQPQYYQGSQHPQ